MSKRKFVSFIVALTLLLITSGYHGFSTCKSIEQDKEPLRLEEEWSVDGGRADIGGIPYIVGDYLVTDKGRFHCHNRFTGEEVWSRLEIPNDRSGHLYLRCIHDNIIFCDHAFLSPLFGYDVQTGELLFELGNKGLVYPYEDRICVVGKENIWCYDYKQQSLNWSIDIPEDLDNEAVLIDGMLLFINHENERIICVNTDNGIGEWTKKVSEDVEHLYQYKDDNVCYFLDKSFYAFNVKDGSSTKTVTMKEDPFDDYSNEIVSIMDDRVVTYIPERIFYPEENNRYHQGVYCDSLETGERMWSYRWMDSSDVENWTKYWGATSYPVAGDDFVYLYIGNDRKLLCLDIDVGVENQLMMDVYGDDSGSEGSISFERMVDDEDRLYITTWTQITCYTKHFGKAPIINTVKYTLGKNVYNLDGLDFMMDVNPEVFEGRTLLPARYVVEPLGGQVFWDGEQRKVTCKLVAPDNTETDDYKENIVELWIDKPTAKINGVEVQIDPDNPDVVPTIINDRTMVPMRFLAESLGCEVEWIAETKEIILTYSP